MNSKESIMLKSKKLPVMIVLEIIFAILLIAFLILVRQQALGYVSEIQSYAGDIDLISQQATQNDLSPEQRYSIDQTVSSFDKILNKSLILLQLILPLTIFIMSIIFFYFIWHFINKITFKRFLTYSIIPIILLLASVFFTINYIAYVYFFVDENPMPYLIVSSLLLIITYYISLFGLSNKNNLKSNLKISLKKFTKVFPFYIIIFITNALYLVFVFYVFFLTFAKASILIQSLILLAVIIIINIQRVHLVKIISRQ